MSSTTASGQGQKRTLLNIVGIILAVIGMALSLYATMHHLDVKATGSTTAFCNINQSFNCDDIARSAYSEVFGIPLGVLGIGYFLGMLTLLGMGMAREEYSRDTLQTYALMAVIGLIVSVILGAVSYFAVGTGCIVCIGIYIVSALQALLVYVCRDAIPRGFTLKSTFNGGTYALLALAVAVGLFNLLKPVSPNVKLDHPQTAEDGHDHGAEPAMLGQPVDLPINKSDFSGLGQDYRQGSDDARVVIVEFADFQCPACRQAMESLRQIKSEYGDRVLVVFKNYPLDSACNPSISRRMHEYACEASILSRCAGRIGKFWQMHDKIFNNQGQLNSNNLRIWAKELGLSDSDIKACLDSKDILAKIQDDIKVGNQAGVDATPTIFINGQKVMGGASYQTLKTEIEKRL